MPLTPPLPNHGLVNDATFFENGNGVLSASNHHGVWHWSFPLDRRSLEAWQRIAASASLALEGGELRERCQLPGPRSLGAL